jgi:enoyl-CoA hydratase
MTELPPKLLVERQGAVTTMILNRPERRNAVDHETALLLRAAFKAFDADDEASVAVLCGAGSSFCAGYDLKSLSGGDIEHDPDGEGPMGPSRLLVGKPVIGAIEGHAVAGGLELALLCDVRIASETAIFGVFCRRWGVPLVDGGTVRLPRVIGQGRALDMILTGRPVDAAEALSFGLANRLVPAGRARAEAEALAAEIARFPQICMRSDRLSAYRQWDKPIEDALALEGRLGEAALRSEAVAGASRFAGGLGRGGDFARIE